MRFSGGLPRLAGASTAAGTGNELPVLRVGNLVVVYCDSPVGYFI
jgi:hypothetical protein